jgi:hypothetical protein
VFLNLAFKKVATVTMVCGNYKIKLKQSNFERNAKQNFSFEHFSLQIHDTDKNCLLKIKRHIKLFQALIGVISRRTKTINVSSL